MEKLKPLKEIFERTCCREFDSSKKISQEQIDLILRAGQAAPSAKNRQPYFFVAIINKDCRKEIFEAAEEGRRRQFAHLSAEDFKKMENGKTGSNDKSIYEAFAAILVLRSSDPLYTEAGNESENLNIKEEQSVATAAYSMMLQAKKLGISSGWVCSPLYIEKELKNILSKYKVSWQDNWKPRLIIPLGYSLADLKKPERKPFNEKTAVIE